LSSGMTAVSAGFGISCALTASGGGEMLGSQLVWRIGEWNHG